MMDDKLRVFVYLSDEYPIDRVETVLKALSDKCQIQVVCCKYCENTVVRLRKLCILYNLELKTIKINKEKWKDISENLSILKAVRYTDIAIIFYTEEQEERKQYIEDMMSYYQKKIYCFELKENKI